VLRPALLEEVPPDQPLCCDEVFGPVAVLDPYEDFAQALAMVNDSRYGLQAGIFTRDADKIQQAWETLEVGGIIQGDVPTWRTDPMPYGGVKGSGVGREGPLFAYREMTEERMLVLRRQP
jgi:acyl-CoA reductase-like NAD-dependent aldehyde dehydrogenase